MKIEVNHVNVTVPKSAESATKTFYRDVLGMKEIPKPGVEKSGGAWFQLGGVQLHLSIEEGVDNRASKRHVCYSVPDLSEAERRLRAAGVEIISESRQIAGSVRFFIRDPGGNHIEIAQQK